MTLGIPIHRRHDIPVLGTGTTGQYYLLVKAFLDVAVRHYCLGCYYLTLLVELVLRGSAISTTLDLLVVHLLNVVDGFAWLVFRSGALCLIVSIDQEVVLWCLITSHYGREALSMTQCSFLISRIQGVQLWVRVEQG